MLIRSAARGKRLAAEKRSHAPRRRQAGRCCRVFVNGDFAVVEFLLSVIADDQQLNFSRALWYKDDCHIAAGKPL
jgi:hypothetical protein